MRLGDEDRRRLRTLWECQLGRAGLSLRRAISRWSGEPAG